MQRPSLDVDELATEVLTFKGVFDPIGIEPSHGGYVMLNIERTTEIMALHEAVLELVATREGVDLDK